MRKRVCSLVVFILLLIGNSFAFAQSPQINSGFFWLTSAQTSTGNWSEVDTTEYYSTAASLDAVYALEPSSAAYTAAFQWMTGQMVSPTDYLSRRIIALKRAGMDVSSEMEVLLLYRNSNGGWGGENSYLSDNLDTALALQALKAANYYDASLLDQSLHYITTNQNLDGGWGFISGNASNTYYQTPDGGWAISPSTSGQLPGGPSNAYVTAVVLRTLNNYSSTFNVQGSIDNAAAFLLAKQAQNNDGGFGSSPSTVYETALSFMALIESGKGGTQALQSAFTYLISAQSTTDGSWNNDPYSTALALQALAATKPNLTITKNDIILSNSMPTIGETITISANIRNTGLDTAANVVVNIYDIDPSQGALPIFSQVIASIPVNGSAALSTSYIVQAAGTGFIYVVIDPANQIPELTKSDNTASIRLWGATLPDLAVSTDDFINYWAYAYPGDQAVFPYRVRNIGESTATNVTVEMYDGNPAQGGRLLGSAVIPSISAGQSATGSFTATFSTEGPTDIYLRVDPLNQVLEADKTNNMVSRSFLVMTHFKPWDLSVDTNDIQLNPSRPHAGDTVQVSAAIHNNTEGPQSGVDVRIYDGDPATGGILLQTWTQLNFAVYETKTLTFSWTMPPGIHTLVAIVDPLNSIDEMNEQNNRAEKRVMVDMVDIQISSSDLTLFPYRPVNGDQAALTIIAHNTGIIATGPFMVGLYNGDPQNGGTLLQTFPVGAIAGDGSASFTYNFAATPQTYRFYAVVDTENTVAELYEDNNTAVRSLKIKSASEITGPDLVPTAVALDKMTFNDATLAIAGSVQLTFQNAGDANIETAFDIRLFEDRDGDGVYTTGTDKELGTYHYASLLRPGGADMIDIPVSSNLRFKASPIYAELDYNNVVTEQSKTNNIIRSGADCEVVPAEPIQPQILWKWRSNLGSTYDEIAAPVAIGPLRDTNGDGHIDQYDIPAIVFTTRNPYVPGGFNAYLRAVRGDTGAEIFTAVRGPFTSRSTPVLGDIDGDGVPEIIVPKSTDSSQGGLLCYRNDGTLKWDNSAQFAAYIDSHGAHLVANLEVSKPVLVDLDGDGRLEIVVGSMVFNFDGSVRWGYTWNAPQGLFNNTNEYNSSVVDLNLDGTQEIVVGNMAYRADGTTLWKNTTVGDGLTAIANLDDDRYPEIVLVTAPGGHGRVYALNHDGTIKWGPWSINEVDTGTCQGWGSQPVVADFDGDGEVEIGISGCDHFAVLTKEGILKLSVPVTYYGNALSDVATVFDLDGDGRPETFHNQYLNFVIRSGVTGTVLYSEPFGGAFWSTQNTFIADVNNDGHAEVIVVGALASYYGVGGYQSGINVYKDNNNKWVGSRSVWNQPAYHVTNVNDDGTVPRTESPSWLLNNTYRCQAPIGPNPNPYLTPNLTASYLRADQMDASVNMSVRVGNGGAAEAQAGVDVTFYDGNPATGTVIGTASTTQALEPGEFQDITYSANALGLGFHQLYAVLNTSNTVTECRKDDNQTTADITVAAGLPDLTVGLMDIIMPPAPYYEGSVIPIFVNVNNLGPVPASNIAVRFYSGNPAAGGVQVGQDQTISSIGAGGIATVAFAYNSLGHTGTNMLYFIVDPLNAVIETSKTNNMALVNLEIQPPVLPDLVISSNDIQLSPGSPQEGNQLTITATIHNLGASASAIPVSFYLGDPASGGVLVSSQTIAPILAFNSATTIQATVDTTGRSGQQQLFVVIDPLNSIPESTKDNDSASKPIFIQSAGLSSSVLLDKAAYQANENMTATIILVNAAPDTRSLVPPVTVKDSAGNVIATISSGDAVTLGPNGTVTLTRTWNSGKNLSGNYSLTTEVAEGGVVISRANVDFIITADKSIESKVTTDKISYKPNETATITSTITSQSANYIQEHLSAKLTIAGSGVQGPGSSAIYTETKTIATLMPGASFTFKNYWNTSAYAPGAYPVLLEVRDASGSLITSGTQTITISSSVNPSVLLRGQVAVDKQSLMAGEPVNVSYSVTNIGNTDIPAVTFSVQTVHVLKQSVYDNLSSQATLTMGGSYTGSGMFNTTTYSAKDYLVVLRANINGIEETLAGTYFRVEGAPTAPALISPAMGSDVDTVTPALTVSNASDPNDDKLTYEFELYADSVLSQLTASSGVLSAGTGTTAWTAPFNLTENATYYWRARAYDGKLYGPWMSPANFRVNTVNDPPTTPVPTSPAETQSVSTLTPVLTVNNASDPDTNGLTYNFQVAMDPDFTQVAASTVGVFSGQGTTSWQVTTGLSENTWYFWRAQADDWLMTGPWSITTRFFVNTTNEAPTVPTILAPANSAVVASLGADIVLANSTDPDSAVISYYVELDTVPTFDSSGIIRSGMVAQVTGSTTWHADGFQDNTLYYVRAKSSDGEADSAWSSAISFFVNIANDAPTAPTLENPSIGAGVNVFTPLLSVHNAADLDRDSLTYEFEVYADAGLSSRVSNTSGVNEIAQITSWTVAIPLTENQAYWWRARAFDGQAYGPWMQTGSFTVNTANDAPGAPALYSPLDGATIATFLPTLSIANAVDPDSDVLTYDFEVYNGSTVVWSRTAVPQDPSGTTSVSVTTALADNTTYQWRGRAYDGDRYGPWMSMAAFTVHVQQTGINVEIEVEPETLNKKNHGNWVMVEIELPHGYHASDVDISSISLEGVVPAETRPYDHYNHHHDHGCEHDHADHDHDEIKVKFDRSSVIAVLPTGDHVPVHVTGRIGSTTFEGVDFIRVIH